MTARFRHPVVLFDAGETLIGPRGSFGAIYARVLASFGVEADGDAIEKALRDAWASLQREAVPGNDRYGSDSGGEERYWLRFVERTLARLPETRNRAELPARALGPLREAFADAASWRVYPDVVPALEALDAAGARVGIVSNWDSRLPRLLHNLGLAPRFHAVVVSSAVGFEKPDPRIFLRALDAFGCEPGRALHVGDVPELDVAGARAAGIAAAIVDRSGRRGASDLAIADLRRVVDLARDGLPGPTRTSSL